MFRTRSDVSAAWIQFAMPTIYTNGDTNRNVQKLSNFTKDTAVALELQILLNSPQPNWQLLVKLLLMRNSYLWSIIFAHLIKHLPSNDCFKAASEQPFAKDYASIEKCKRFLCDKECNSIAEWACTDEGNDASVQCEHPNVVHAMVQLFFFLFPIRAHTIDPVGQTNYQVVLALTYVLTFVGRSSDIKSTLIASLNRLAQRDWSNCLDRRQVWNQKRPPWFEAMHHLIYPVLPPIINILVSSMQTGATIYQVTILCPYTNTV